MSSIDVDDNAYNGTVVTNEELNANENSEMTGRSEDLFDEEEYTEEMTNVDKVKRNKRMRELDESEVWSRGRRDKLFARSSSAGERIPEDIIELSLSSYEKLPRRFGLAKLLKSQDITDIIRIKYTNPFKVLIQLSNVNSAEALYNSQFFKEKGYKCQKTYELNYSYGVIKDIEVENSEEEVLENLTSDTVIIAAKRLKRKNIIDGQWVPSETIRLCFKGSSLPSYVYLFGTKTLIYPYTYPVTQCSRCWRFGHSIKMCPSVKTVCPKCSGFHPNCDAKDFKCNNCGGKHMTLAKSCPAYIRERKLRDLMADFNCSYKKAQLLYVPPSPLVEQYSQEAPFEPTAETNIEETLEIDVSNEEQRDRPYYADIAKRDYNRKQKIQHQPLQSGKRKKNKQINHAEDEFEIGESIDIENSEMISDNTKNKEKKDMSHWRILIKKLRDKILENNLTWEEKFKGCVDIICEKFLSVVASLMSSLPRVFQQWIQGLVKV